MTRSARRLVAALAVGALLVLAGCSSGGDDAGSVAGGAPEGFTAVTLVVTRADGSIEEWCVWLADNQAERGRGLMFVDDPGLGGKDGMAFVFPEDTGASFYMKNTLLPLSIAYIDGEGRIVSVTDMEPCPAETLNCPVYSPGGAYRVALEVPKGRLAALGIEMDSRVAVSDNSCKAR